MLIEKEYLVLLNQKIQSSTEEMEYPHVARAAILKPGYVLTALPKVFPKISLYTGDAKEIAYYTRNAMMAEQDLSGGLNAVENFAEIESLSDEERQAGLQNAAVELMVKAKTYRTLFMSNTQNFGTYKQSPEMTSTGLAKNIAAAISFSQNVLPRDEYAKLDKALGSSLTMTLAN